MAFNAAAGALFLEMKFEYSKFTAVHFQIIYSNHRLNFHFPRFFLKFAAIKMPILSQFFSNIKNSLGFISKTSSPLLVVTEPQQLKLKVISSKFGVILIKVLDTTRGFEIKKAALEVFKESCDSPYFATLNEISDEVVDKFKLIRVKTRKEIQDFQKLKELKISKDEEFLLNEHGTPVPDAVTTLNLAGPTEFQIIEATASLKKSKPKPPPFDVKWLLMQDDMRKIFVTLAQESAYILGVSPYALKLIAYYRQRIFNCIKNDRNAVKVMVKLGFDEESVEHAMEISANNYKIALDWLIENEVSTEPDENFFNQPQRRSSDRNSSLIVTSSRRNSILSSKYSSALTVQDRIAGLLEIVNFFSEKEEIVYDENISDMIWMGFDAEVSRKALRLTRNNIAAAIAHIQGDENPSITELRDGIASTSEIRKKFFESTQILQSLGEPKFFELFINVLDNPTQANAWNPFSEVGSLMTHIIITYHEEKHINATNQFNQSRLPVSALSAPT